MTTDPARLGAWLTALCALLLMQSVQAQQPRDPTEHFFHQGFGDFSEELENAREEGLKGVLLFFEDDDCPFCARMKSSILNRPEVQDYFRSHFRILSVDVNGDLEITDFKGDAMAEKDFASRHNRVRATPVMAFFNLDGKRVARYTGAASSIEEFMLLGRYVVEEQYRKSSFVRYKRSMKSKP